jgi:hypothetical protein
MLKIKWTFSDAFQEMTLSVELSEFCTSFFRGYFGVDDLIFPLYDLSKSCFSVLSTAVCPVHWSCVAMVIRREVLVRTGGAAIKQGHLRLENTSF